MTVNGYHRHLGYRTAIVNTLDAALPGTARKRIGNTKETTLKKIRLPESSF
jgi:hypothetical protein